MPSPFRVAAAAHATAVQATNGERLRLHPQGQGGDFTTGGADPDRPVVEFVGTIVGRPTVVYREGAGANSAEAAAINGAAWWVSWPSVLAIPARAGDEVERLDDDGQPTGERFRLFRPLSIPGRVRHPADQVS